MAAVSQIRYRGTHGRTYYDRKVAEGMQHKSALRALKRRISDALYAQLNADRRHPTHAADVDPGGQSGNDSASSAAGSHPEQPALRISHSRADTHSRTSDPRDLNRSCRLGLLLLSADPGGAEPESSWSPGRDRDAGAGRNELDTGEHPPTPSGRRSKLLFTLQRLTERGLDMDGRTSGRVRAPCTQIRNSVVGTLDRTCRLPDVDVMHAYALRCRIVRPDAADIAPAKLTRDRRIFCGPLNALTVEFCVVMARL
jgi:hypothetical protein